MRPLRILAAALPLACLALSDARAGEWETMRDTLEATVRTHGARVGDIEAREKTVRDPHRRAEKITRDRVAALQGAAKGSGTVDPGERLAAITSDWGTDGRERRALRDGLVTLQKNLERANASLARAAEVAEGAAGRLMRSGVLDKVRHLEDEEKARAQWQLDQAARERERLQRERQAAERERGVR